MRNEERMNSKAFNEMSTDELRALLHQDIWEDSLDDVSIERITEELRKRGREDASFAEPRLDESWRRLQERLAQEPGIWELEPAKAKPKRDVRWFRTAIAAAAVFAVVCMAALPATADGENPINYIATWTKDEFWLSPIRDVSQDSVKYKNLPDLLRKYDITEPLLPGWIPEDYSYVGCDLNDDFYGGTFLQIHFQHSDMEKVFSLTILDHTTETEMFAVKDDRDVVFYPVNGIQHYILSYNDIKYALWVNDEIRCSLGGNVTEEELKKMIDSIYQTVEAKRK